MNSNEVSLREKKIKSEKLFKGRIIDLELDQVELPNGKTATREVIRHKGAVCIIPVLENGNIIMERQFRYPLDRVVLEIPAGKLEEGEEPEVCARRELCEETGYYANELEYLGMMVGCPALLDERIYMYAAYGLEKRETNFDEDEFLICEEIPFDTLIAMVMNGDIADAKTQIAVLKLNEKRRKNG